MKPEFVFVLLAVYVGAFLAVALMIVFDGVARSIGDLDLPTVEVIE